MADKTIVVRAVYRSNVSQGMRQDAGAVSSFSAQVQSSTGQAISKTKALGAASAIAGKLLVLGIGGAMAVSAKAAIDFESSMAGVAKTTDLLGNSFDRNSGPLFAFGEALRALSLRIPINVNELAGIAALGGQLGIEVPNLIRFTEVMAALGVSTNLSSQEAATGFARFANIMRTPHDQFERLGSVVVELGNNLATTESEILKFGTRLAPIGRIVGATEEEVFALSGAMTSLGVPAERGGTALQKWFILAKTAVDEGGESLARFARVAGMTAEEFKTLFRESPGRAFAAFASGLDHINKSGGNVFQTLKDLQLSEVRTTQVMLAAAGGIDVLTNSLNLAENEGKEVNALFIESARRYGTTESAIRLVANAFTDLRIEIGNMILGTGGLAFSIDVIREFFGVIKDNLGILGAFAKAAGVLVGLKLGITIFQSFQKASVAAKAMYSLAAATTAVTTSSRLVQGSLILVTAGMQGMLGIAGALAAVWAIQAINAATLRAEIRALQDEIDQGVDAFTVFHDSVQESLSQKQIDLLNDMGVSTEALTRYLLDGRDAASEVGQIIDSVMRPDLGDMGRQEMEEAGKAAVTLGNILNVADQKVEGFFSVTKSDLRNALVETGSDIKLTEEQFDRLFDRAIELFGYDVTNEEFVQSVNAFLLGAGPNMARWRGEFEEAQRILTQGFRVDKSWTDFLNPDDRENIVEDFMDDNTGAVIEFRETMADEFSRVGDIVKEGMPAWEEYEQTVLEATGKSGESITASVKDALAAQDLFLEDTRDWITRMPSIMDMGASTDTVGWIESLENPIRGAIGRLNDAQLQELIDGANANFDELHTLHLQRWMQLYPGAANVAFGAMVGELGKRVEEMNLPGQEAGEAFRQGLMEVMSQLPEEDRGQFLQYVAALLSNEEWMRANGLDSGGGWIEGLVAALANIAGKAIPVLAWQLGLVKSFIDDSFGRKSPSKWFFRLGRDMVTGLEQGLGNIGSAFQGITPEVVMPNVSQTIQNLSLTGQGGGNTRTTHISIVSPQTQNLRGDIQQGLLADSLVSEVEGF